MTRGRLGLRGSTVGRAFLVFVVAAFVLAMLEPVWAQGGGIQYPPRIDSRDKAGQRTKAKPDQHPNPPGG